MEAEGEREGVLISNPVEVKDYLDEEMRRKHDRQVEADRRRIDTRLR